MRSDLRVAILGLGTIGRFHLDAARRAGANVVALASSSLERAQAHADEFGIPAFADDRRVFEDSSIDVVHICTPNVLHYQQARAALLAGKNVICEKPLTMNSRQLADFSRSPVRCPRDRLQQPILSSCPRSSGTNRRPQSRPCLRNSGLRSRRLILA